MDEINVLGGAPQVGCQLYPYEYKCVPSANGVMDAGRVGFRPASIAGCATGVIAAYLGFTRAAARRSGAGPYDGVVFVEHTGS